MLREIYTGETRLPRFQIRLGWKCHKFARNLPSFCSYPENWSQVEFKDKRLICLVEGISKQWVTKEAAVMVRDQDGGETLLHCMGEPVLHKTEKAS